MTHQDHIHNYVRKSAEKYKWYRYYSINRPVDVGTQPQEGFMDYINFDMKIEILGKSVWAELYYNRPLTDEELNQYELITIDT